MESPEAARAMAWPMVLQAVREDLQLLESLPCTPSTYHVLAVRAEGDTAKSSAKSGRLPIVSLRFIVSSTSWSRLPLCKTNFGFGLLDVARFFFGCRVH